MAATNLTEGEFYRHWLKRLVRIGKRKPMDDMTKLRADKRRRLTERNVGD